MFYKANIAPIFLFIALVVTGGNSYADNINYILAARQHDLLKNMDRIADMSANVNTTGFKAENDVFTEYKKRTSNREELSFPQIGKTVRDTKQGGMEKTGRQFDIAINGAGYFMVNTPFGPMYTRNGSMMVNKDGTLVNQDGYPMAGPGGGQIDLNEKDIDISIKEDGLVKSGDEERGQLGVFMFDNESLLERMGQGLFKSPVAPKIAENAKIAQGMLETSNVNSVTAMTNLVAVSRGIESIHNINSTHNDIQLDMIRKMSQ